MMRFLLTNDDGIAAPGLWAAARTLAQLGSVLIVAPARNHSGFGPAHPPASSVAFAPYPVEDSLADRVRAYALEATPAACAHMGLAGAFGGRPIDLVVSGVNAGLNVGHDVLYSGTVGAALTAHLLGWPAVAVSLDWWEQGEAHWETTAWAIHRAIAMWQRAADRTPVVLNVNVPNIPLAQVGGARITTLGTHSFLGRYRFVPDEETPHVIRALRREPLGSGQPPISNLWEDGAAVAHGFISITPLRPFPDVLCVAPWAEAPEQAAVYSKTKGG
ncbi:MAG: 5'/3'-nucleotidase SurE [Anaerolineae bacterium]|nr:5'/3'-nucleotidase SurE [Anaerolineae bacterium]